jgi:hypothetical protein
MNLEKSLFLAVPYTKNLLTDSLWLGKIQMVNLEIWFILSRNNSPVGLVLTREKWKESNVVEKQIWKIILL